MKVYIFRHGETDWNREERIQGSTDIPLNELGKRQAEELADRLADFKIEILFCSPLARAQETAAVLQRRISAPIVALNDLREAHFGQAEGKTRSQLIKEMGAEFWERWRSVSSEDMHFDFIQGESKASVRDRAFACLTKHMVGQKYLCVAVSTHGAVLRYLAHALLPEGADLTPVPNCACYLFEFDPNLLCWSFVGPVP